MSKLYIVTGSCGFVGSHLVEHILETTDAFVIGIDSFKHGGFSARARWSVDNLRYKIITHDLSRPIDDHTAKEILNYFEFDQYTFLNLASNSHVDDSIKNPAPFIENNISVAINALEFCRKYRGSLDKFIQCSTDEVFGPAYGDYRHHEWDTILPSNPYAASKAAQESICFSYWRTYDMPIYITRCMNMIGKGQGKEKFLPTIIRKICKEELLEIHGTNHDNIGSRMYIHSRNLADAWLFLDKNTRPDLYSHGRLKPQAYNIAGELELNNLDLAKIVAEYMGKDLLYNIVDFHSARPGHDLRYALDQSKIFDLGWRPPIPLVESIHKTVDWYLENTNWL